MNLIKGFRGRWNISSVKHRPVSGLHRFAPNRAPGVEPSRIRQRQHGKAPECEVLKPRFSSCRAQHLHLNAKWPAVFTGELTCLRGPSRSACSSVMASFPWCRSPSSRSRAALWGQHWTSAKRRSDQPRGRQKMAESRSGLWYVITGRTTIIWKIKGLLL